MISITEGPVLRCELKFKLLILLLVGLSAHNSFAQHYSDDDPFGHRHGDDGFGAIRGVDLMPMVRFLVGSDRQQSKNKSLDIDLMRLSRDLDSQRLIHQYGDTIRPLDFAAPIKCELPIQTPDREEFQAANHLILWDDSSSSRQTDVFLNWVWSEQVKILKRNLMDLGVPENQIQIVGVQSAAQLESQIVQSFAGEQKPNSADTAGPTVSRRKYVYLFGHANRLTAHVGSESYRFEERLPFLLENNVSMLGHYGCSFLQDCNVIPGENNQAPSSLGIDPAQSTSPRTLTLFGHRDVSRAHLDDSPFDSGNPLIVAELRCTPDNRIIDTLPPAQFGELNALIFDVSDLVGNNQVKDADLYPIIYAYDLNTNSGQTSVKNNNYQKDFIFINNRLIGKDVPPMGFGSQSSQLKHLLQAPKSFDGR